jgi:hypothetical protein
MKRGAFGFEVTATGDLLDVPANFEALRRLWLDRDLINGEDLGPGNDGDFDVGAWHVGCHLVAAGGVRRSASGQLLYLELSYDRAKDEYFASVTADGSGPIRTHRVDSADGQGLLRGSALVGFIEGNSLGRISARGTIDTPNRFNGWRRQSFDRSASETADGGKVWEHWCTLRDIRSSASVGSSVLKAYIGLCAALGDLFVPTVARGRRDYGHPQQLCAMVRAGLTSESSATWAGTPTAIPPAAEALLLEARPGDSIVAARLLTWSNSPCYHMFRRRIGHWSPADAVTRDWGAFPR